ncbi:hypothetical protein KGQ96_14960 [Halomonas coralii]|nr:hypothetical protein [Modicisalibacter sp. R2A 31.J]MBZ9576487.1 hypothetical protein [Modicisalibacter sp. MOD 31.J]
MTAPSQAPTRRMDFQAACLRALLYSLATAAQLLAVQWYSATHHGIALSEDGLTEHLQSLLLAAGVLLLATQAPGGRPYCHVARLLLGFLLASSIREQDAFLDTHVADGAWQVMVALVVIAALGDTWRHRRRFLAEFQGYADSFAFGLFAGGFLCTYVFSRLFGSERFWQAVLQDHYLRLFKTAAEEVTETFGYTLILFAVVELLLLARRLRRRRADERP